MLASRWMVGWRSYAVEGHPIFRHFPGFWWRLQLLHTRLPHQLGCRGLTLLHFSKELRIELLVNYLYSFEYRFLRDHQDLLLGWNLQQTLNLGTVLEEHELKAEELVNPLAEGFGGLLQDLFDS